MFYSLPTYVIIYSDDIAQNYHFLSSLYLGCLSLLGLPGLFIPKFHSLNPWNKLKPASPKTTFLYPFLKCATVLNPSPIFMFYSTLWTPPICCWYIIISFGGFTVIESLPSLPVTFPTPLAIVFVKTCKVLLSFRIFVTMPRCLSTNH